MASSADNISSISSSSRRGADQLVFLAKTNSAKNIATMLGTVNIQKETIAAAIISDFGLRFVTDKASSFQASVFLKAELFHEFKCTEQQSFGINLTSLLECLNLFGASLQHVTLQIRYAGVGNEFQIQLEENGTMSTCNLATLDTAGPVDFHFGNSSVVNKVIFQSNALKEALAELQFWGDDIRIQMAPQRLRMSSTGSHGACVLDFPEDTECFDMFDVRAVKSCRYKMSLLQCMTKALSFGDKVSLRVNEIGMLSVQLMIRDSPVASFTEFVICADEEMDDVGSNLDE